MTILRVDDISVPLEARTFLGELAGLGPDYEIQITLQENEWLPYAWEHIQVFIQTPVGIAAMGALIKAIGNVFVAWVKKQRLKRPEQDQKKLTIYGPDGKIVKVITCKGDTFEQK